MEVRIIITLSHPFLQGIKGIFRMVVDGDDLLFQALEWATRGDLRFKIDQMNMKREEEIVSNPTMKHKTLFE